MGKGKREVRERQGGDKAGQGGPRANGRKTRGGVNLRRPNTCGRIGRVERDGTFMPYPYGTFMPYLPGAWLVSKGVIL